MKYRKIKNKGGRPSKCTRDVIRKLEQAFEIGANITEAVAVAKISHDTFHSWMKKVDGFAEKMARARAFSDLKAKKIVTSKIIEGNDLETAKWWLEKRQFNQKDTLGIELSDGEKVTRFIVTRGNAELPTRDEESPKLLTSHDEASETPKKLLNEPINEPIAQNG